MNQFKPKVYIALGGRAGHGKTTLSRGLQDAIRSAGRICEITSFATVPKRMLSAMGLTDEQLYGSEKEIPSDMIAGHTPRFAMQSLATEWGRNMLYETIWVDAWQRHAESLDCEYIIVDDLRHVPELERLKEMKALIFEVYRPSKMPQTPWQWVKHWYKQMHAHSSERLDFQKHGIQRIVIEEGQPDKTLQKLLALIRQVQ